MDKGSITINYLNVYHLFNKIESVIVELTKPSSFIHILGLSETRLHERMGDNSISVPDYTLIRRDKQQLNHTGLAVYIHNSISPYTKRRLDLENNKIECIWLDIKTNTATSVLVCIIYRNPIETSQWLDNFETMIDSIPDKDYEIIIEGDFNIDLNKSQPVWNNMTTSLGLYQLIKDFTRVTETSEKIIDHIYTTNKDKTYDAKVIKSGISDHFMISCNYIHKLPKASNKGHTSIQYRCYKKFNNITFLADVSELPFDNVYNSTDPNEAL